MELNSLQRFEQARQMAQQKLMSPKAPAQNSAMGMGEKFLQALQNKSVQENFASKPQSLQDLIRSKQQELGLQRPQSMEKPALANPVNLGTMTYGRGGKVQQNTILADTPQKRPLGNYFDIVG